MNILFSRDGVIEADWNVDLTTRIGLKVDDTEFTFTIHQLLGEPAECFRCCGEISSQLEVVWLDREQRSDCPDADDLGVPHEPDPEA